MSALLRIFTTFVTSILLFATVTQFALAVGLKPLRTEMTIKPGDTQTATLTIINSEDRQLTVRPEIQVYVRNDTAGYPIEAELSADDPRNIASWISFTEETVDLAPKSTKEVLFTVVVPKDAEPGGRYASLLYSPVLGKNDGGVQIQTRVASLLLITVAGEQNFNGQLTEFGIKDNKIYSDQPVQLAVGFENQGNVHVKAAGDITLTDETGAKVTGTAYYTDPQTGQNILADAIPVNLNRGNILPTSTRVFVSDWNRNIKPGKYVAALTLYYAADRPPLTQTTPITIDENILLDSLDLKIATNEAGEENSQFVLTATNNGDVYERLQGTIEVTNEFGDLVRTIEIPKDIAYLTPGETQTFNFDFLAKKIKAGEYTAILSATYGFDATPITIKTNFSSKEDSILSLLQSPTGLAAVGGLIVVLIILAFWAGRRKTPPPIDISESQDPPEPPAVPPTI